MFCRVSGSIPVQAGVPGLLWKQPDWHGHAHQWCSQTHGGGNNRMGRGDRERCSSWKSKDISVKGDRRLISGALSHQRSYNYCNACNPVLMLQTLQTMWSMIWQISHSNQLVDVMNNLLTLEDTSISLRVYWILAHISYKYAIWLVNHQLSPKIDIWNIKLQ